MAQLNFHVTFLGEVSLPGKYVREKTEFTNERADVQVILVMKLGNGFYWCCKVIRK